MGSLPDRLFKFIEPEPMSGCWLWNGGTTRGYGRYWDKGGTPGAHRVVYELLVGPIPKGLHLDHKCRMPSCVNPDHLRPVTPRENAHAPGSLCLQKTNAAKTHCPHGHPYDAKNTMSQKAGKNGIGRRCRTCGGKDALARYYRNKESHAATS